MVLRTKEAAELTVKEVQDGGAAAGVVGGDGGHGHGVGEEQVHGHGVDGAGVGRRLGKFHLFVCFYFFYLFSRSRAARFFNKIKRKNLETRKGKNALEAQYC